jgi:tetratricopeptide (TPR) repeat protein
MYNLHQSLVFAIKLLFIFAILFMFCQCGVHQQTETYTKNKEKKCDEPIHPTKRYEDYYERGLVYLEKGCFEEAIEDFNNAVKERSKDQWAARGGQQGHFIDYFPHREMGIAYYKKGELEKAKEFLEKSLKQSPSDKARYYLDRVREKLIANQQTDVPKLTLDFSNLNSHSIVKELPNDNKDKKYEIWTNDDPVIIAGNIEDKQFVSSVSISGEHLGKKELFFEDPLQNSAVQRHLKKYLNMSDGEHKVYIEAKNLKAGSANHQITFNVDRKGPLIGFDNPIPSEDGEVIIRGSLSDKTGVSAFYINEEKITSIEYGNKKIPFEIKVPEAEEYHLVAYDKLDNKSSADIFYSHNTTPSLNETSALIASADLQSQYDVSGPNTSSCVTINTPDLKDKVKVYVEEICFKLEAKSTCNKPIVKIKIFTEPSKKMSPIPDFYWSENVGFDANVTLDEGANTIHMQAWVKDNDQPIEEKKITIVKGIPASLKIDNRLSLLVFKPENKDQTSANLSSEIQKELIEAFETQGRFDMSLTRLFLRKDLLNSSKDALKIAREKVIYRLSKSTLNILKEKTDKKLFDIINNNFERLNNGDEKEKVEMFLKEKGIKKKYLSTVLEHFEKVKADHIIIGTIKPENSGYEIKAIMSDTRNELNALAPIERDVYNRDHDKNALLNKLAENMAIKLGMNFPLIEGNVISQAEGETLCTREGRISAKFKEKPVPVKGLTDNSAIDKIELKPRQLIIVYSNINNDNIWGDAKIERWDANKNTALAALYCNPKDIKCNDGVITK